MNDRGYGVIKRIQDSLQGGRRFYGDLLGPELVRAWPRSPAFRSSRSRTGRHSARRWPRRWRSAAGPVLVEVDMTAIGEFPPYYPFNVSRMG